MNLEEIVKKINSLYCGIDTFAISFEARCKAGFQEDKTLVYGEALVESLAEILKIVQPKKGEIFYDLGSGGGKVVLAAGMMFPFAKVVGVEKLPELVETSKGIAPRPALLLQGVKLPQIEFHCQDFLEADFSDADIIFVNSTCLPYEVMDRLAFKMENLKDGARIITVTKQIKVDYLKEFEVKKFDFSWGEATVYFYKKYPASR